MEYQEVTAEELAELEADARRRRVSGPVKVREMTEAERASFALDIDVIRKRGMFGARESFR